MRNEIYPISGPAVIRRRRPGSHAQCRTPMPLIHALLLAWLMGLEVGATSNDQADSPRISFEAELNNQKPVYANDAPLQINSNQATSSHATSCGSHNAHMIASAYLYAENHGSIAEAPGNRTILHLGNRPSQKNVTNALSPMQDRVCCELGQKSDACALELLVRANAWHGKPRIVTKESQMARLSLIQRGLRAIYAIGSPSFERAGDSNRSIGLGPTIDVDDDKHKAVSQIFNLGKGLSGGNLAFQIKDPMKLAATSERRIQCDATSKNTLMSCGRMMPHDRTGHGPSAPFMSANIALLGHQHPQLSGIRESTNTRGGIIKIDKAGLGTALQKPSTLPPIPWKSETKALAPAAAASGSTHNPPLSHAAALVGKDPKAGLTVERVRESVLSFCDSTCTGLISNVRAFPEDFSGLMRNKQPIPIISAKMDVTESARQEDIARLLVESRLPTSSWKVPGAIMDPNDSSMAIRTMGQPLMELVGKQVSQDTIDSLSITVACQMSTTPGPASSLSSFKSSESGTYNLAAMTSDFAIALQTKLAADYALDSSPEGALAEWVELQELVTKSDRPNVISDAAHYDVLAALKAGYDILNDRIQAASATALGGEQMDFNTSPMSDKATEDAALISLATAAVHTYQVYWPHSRYREMARRSAGFQLLQFDDIRSTTRPNGPKEATVKILPINQTAMDDIISSLPWTLDWPGRFKVEISAIKVHEACQQIPPLIIDGLAPLGLINTSNSPEVAAISGHLNRLICARLAPAINYEKARNTNLNNTISTEEVFILNAEDGKPHKLSSLDDSSAASFFAPADTPTIPLTSRTRTMLPDKLLIFPASKASRAAIIMVMDKKNLLMGSNNKTWCGTEPRISIPSSPSDMPVPPPLPNTPDATTVANIAAYASLTAQSYSSTLVTMQSAAAKAKAKSLSMFTQVAICKKLITVPDTLITPSKFTIAPPQEEKEEIPNYADYDDDAFAFLDVQPASSPTAPATHLTNPSPALHLSTTHDAPAPAAHSTAYGTPKPGVEIPTTNTQDMELAAGPSNPGPAINKSEKGDKDVAGKKQAKINTYLPSDPRPKPPTAPISRTLVSALEVGEPFNQPQNVHCVIPTLSHTYTHRLSPRPRTLHLKSGARAPWTSPRWRQMEQPELIRPTHRSYTSDCGLNITPLNSYISNSKATELEVLIMSFLSLALILILYVIPIPTCPIDAVIIARLRIQNQIYSRTLSILKGRKEKLDQKEEKSKLRKKIKYLTQKTRSLRAILQYHINRKIIEARRRGDKNWGQYTKMSRRQIRHIPRAASLPAPYHAMAPHACPKHQITGITNCQRPLATPLETASSLAKDSKPFDESPTDHPPYINRDIAVKSAAMATFISKNQAISLRNEQMVRFPVFPTCRCYQTAPRREIDQIRHRTKHIDTRLYTRSVAFLTPTAGWVPHLTQTASQPQCQGYCYIACQKLFCSLLARAVIAQKCTHNDTGPLTPHITHPTPLSLAHNPSPTLPTHPLPLVGGASPFYSITTLKQMNNTLKRHGLQAIWDSPWYSGDCGWDALACLSGKSSLEIRRGAMDLLFTHLASLDALDADGTAEADDTHSFITSMVEEHRARGGWRTGLGTPEQYIALMRLSAKQGGLWIDNLALAWAGTALEANIEVYQYTNGTLTLMPLAYGPPEWPTYRLLYTRGPPGHYTPLSLNPTVSGINAEVPLTHAPGTYRRAAPRSPTRPLSAVQPEVQPSMQPEIHLEIQPAMRQYREPQHRRFCWLHAFNMIHKACLNNKSIDPSDVIQWFDNERRCPRFPHHLNYLNIEIPHLRPYDPHTGNFNQSSFAYWAFLTQGARISSVPFSPTQLSEDHDSLSNFLSNTLKGLQNARDSTLPSFILTTEETNDTITYGHATALIHEDSTWYWLDSDPDKGHRIALTDPRGVAVRRELLTVAKCLYTIDYGAHTLSDCPLACDLFPPEQRAPWHIDITTDTPNHLHDDLCRPPSGAPHADFPLHSQPHRPAPHQERHQDVKPTAAPLQDKTTQSTIQDRLQDGTKTTKIGSQAPSLSKNRGHPRRNESAMHKRVPEASTDITNKKKKSDQHESIRAFFAPPLLPTQSAIQNHVQQQKNTSLLAPASLTLLQINAQGSLWTIREDVTNLAHKHTPDVIGICDIGLKSKNKYSKWVQATLAGYQYKAITHTNTEGRALHGVMIAVKDHLAKLCNPTVSTNDTCDGRLLHITLHPPHSQPLGISEVYAPAGNTPDDNHLRQRIYASLNLLTHGQQVTASGPSHNIHSGDWNATLYESDRTSNTTYEKDLAHREFIEANNLLTTDKVEPRAYTYHHSESNSRIDDVFTTFKCDAHTTTLEEGTLSDHSPLLTTITLNGHNLFLPKARPLPVPPSVKTIVRPISVEDRAKFNQAINSYSIGQASQIQALHQELTSITNSDIQPYFDSIHHHTGKTSNRLTSIQGVNAATVIEHLSTQLITIGSAARKVMLNTCATKITNPSGSHYCKRRVNKHRRRLTMSLRDTRILHREVMREGTNTIDTATNLFESRQHELSQEFLSRWRVAVTANEEVESPTTSASEVLIAMKSTLRKEIKNIDKDKSTATLQQAIEHTRRMIDTKPRLANRHMRQSHQPKIKYPAFYDPTSQQRTDDPIQMNKIVSDYFTKTLSTPPSGKTGKYLPSESPRSYIPMGARPRQIQTRNPRIAAHPTTPTPLPNQRPHYLRGMHTNPQQ